jgi:hypothetical protein
MDAAGPPPPHSRKGNYLPRYTVSYLRGNSVHSDCCESLKSHKWRLSSYLWIPISQVFFLLCFQTESSLFFQTSLVFILLDLWKHIIHISQSDSSYYKKIILRTTSTTYRCLSLLLGHSCFFFLVMSSAACCWEFSTSQLLVLCF